MARAAFTIRVDGLDRPLRVRRFTAFGEEMEQIETPSAMHDMGAAMSAPGPIHALPIEVTLDMEDWPLAWAWWSAVRQQDKAWRTVTVDVSLPSGRRMIVRLEHTLLSHFACDLFSEGRGATSLKLRLCPGRVFLEEADDPPGRTEASS